MSGTKHIYFQGYKRKKEFIITQMPLSTTKTDFWRLVEEHDVHTIVMMNNESEAKVSVIQPKRVCNTTDFGKCWRIYNIVWSFYCTSVYVRYYYNIVIYNI